MFSTIIRLLLPNADEGGDKYIKRINPTQKIDYSSLSAISEN